MAADLRARAAPRPLDVRNTVEAEFVIPGQRLKIPSPAAGSSWKQGVTVTEDCRLVGVTLFVDAPDSGDYVDLYLGGRVLQDRLQIDLLANTSYTVSFSARARKGDLLEARYFSAGTSAKNLSWTPKAVVVRDA